MYHLMETDQIGNTGCDPDKGEDKPAGIVCQGNRHCQMQNICHKRYVNNRKVHRAAKCPGPRTAACCQLKRRLPQPHRREGTAHRTSKCNKSTGVYSTQMLKSQHLLFQQLASFGIPLGLQVQKKLARKGLSPTVPL